MYHRELKKNLCEKQKLKLVEYIKSYFLAHESKLFSPLIKLFLTILGQLKKKYIEFPHYVFWKLLLLLLFFAMLIENTFEFFFNCPWKIRFLIFTFTFAYFKQLQRSGKLSGIWFPLIIRWIKFSLSSSI